MPPHTAAGVRVTRAHLGECARCASPVYRLTHLPSGEPVQVDWLPLPYGAHVVRTASGACVIAADPATDGAYLRVRLVDATCQHVLPADAAVDAARMIYHQDHAETCAIWCRGHIETNWRAWAHEEAE